MAFNLKDLIVEALTALGGAGTVAVHKIKAWERLEKHEKNHG